MCVLKGKDGRDGLSLGVDYRCVNRFTRDDVFLLPDIGRVFQCLDRNHFIHVTDLRLDLRVIVRSMLISLTQMSSVVQVTVVVFHN